MKVFIVLFSILTHYAYDNSFDGVVSTNALWTKLPVVDYPIEMEYNHLIGIQQQLIRSDFKVT